MPTVLLLDGDEARSRGLVELIRRATPGIGVQAFLAPEPALAWLYWRQADLVVADGRFPGLSTAELIRRIRATRGCTDLPLLIMAPRGNKQCRREVLEAGATDLLATPVDGTELRARCSHLLTQHLQKRIIHERALRLEERVSQVTAEIRKREQETLLRLAKAGEYRDEDAGNHVMRMAKYARLIAERMGLAESECELIELAAPMHDIGKIGIPDRILRNPGPLSDAEFAIMKTHTLIGYEILKDSPSECLQMAAVIALGHHERFDGTGYPHRLAGQDIPLAARIVSVADAYDALTTARPCRPKWSPGKALEFLDTHRGRTFDPDCLDAFQAQLDRVARVQHLLGDQPLTSSNRS